MPRAAVCLRCKKVTSPHFPILKRAPRQARGLAGKSARQTIVVALGGNALLKRGEPLTMENQSAAAAGAPPPASR